MNRLLLFNENAANASPQHLSHLLSALGEGTVACPVHRTLRAAELMRQLPNDGRVILSGGDGSLNRYLPALVERQLPVLIVPVGTVNDVADSLGLNRNPDLALDFLRSGPVHRMDVLHVGKRQVLAYAATGLGARTDHVSAVSRRWTLWLRRRKPSFVAPINALSALALHRRLTRSIEVVSLSGADPVVLFRGECSGIVASNLRHLNGQVRVHPCSRDDDGIFELLILLPTDRLRLVRLVADPGKATSLEDFEGRLAVQRGSHFVVRSLDGVPLHYSGDGEYFGESLEISVRVLAGALPVIVGSPEGVKEPGAVATSGLPHG